MTERPSADTITQAQLDALYADEARSEEVIGEQNETIIGAVRSAARLRDQLAILAGIRHTPQELEGEYTADKAMARRIHQARPGVPVSNILAVLEALRAVHEMSPDKPADETPALAEARATNQRLNRRAQELESELAAYRRAVAQWEVSERGTYIPYESLRTIGRASGKDPLGSIHHLRHFERVEQAEAALRQTRRRIRELERMIGEANRLRKELVDQPDTPEAAEEAQAEREQTEHAHAQGDHAHCGVTCETVFPSNMLRAGILYRALPGSTRMLDELLRRAARLAPGEAVGFQEVPLKGGGTYVRLDRLADGRIMCQLCFNFCTRDELNPVEGGVEDVCQSCALLEAAQQRIRELEGQAREADRLRKDWTEQRDLAEAAQARVRGLEAQLRIVKPWVCPVCGKENNQDPCVICETDRPDAEETVE